MIATFVRRLGVLMAVVMLSACGGKAQPTPTSTSLPPARIPTFTFIPSPSTTRTLLPTRTPLLSSTPTATPGFTPLDTLAVSPTPPSGWATYTNEYLGYSFNYPPGAKIDTKGAEGVMDSEGPAPGFSTGEYLYYVMAVLPKNLCVTVSFPEGDVFIAPPFSPIGSFVNLCPSLGIGEVYRMESARETWTIAGSEVEARFGDKLHANDTDAFYTEFYSFILSNGFMVTFYGTPGMGNTSTDYAAKRTARRILASLRWFRVPDLTKPGTTCAGKFTHLVPNEEAVVTGAPSDPPNRVRAEPSLASRIISQLYPQTIVKIIEGPVCAGGLVFWKIAQPLIPGGSGWTAEGDGTNYWLEPYRP